MKHHNSPAPKATEEQAEELLHIKPVENSLAHSIQELSKNKLPPPIEHIVLPVTESKHMFLDPATLSDTSDEDFDLLSKRLEDQLRSHVSFLLTHFRSRKFVVFLETYLLCLKF